MAQGKTEGLPGRQIAGFKDRHGRGAWLALTFYPSTPLMKKKHILSALALIALPFVTISCGEKKSADTEGSEPAAEGSQAVAAKTHAEISEGVVDEMTGLMTDMAGIKDVASAEAFAKSMPDRKAKVKSLLKAAQALEAPTAEEKAAYQLKMNAAQEKAGPAMMAMMMGMSQNPEAEAIGEIMEKVMEDEEMEEVSSALEDIYAVEEEPEME